MLEGTAVLWEEFQSTLPVRGATLHPGRFKPEIAISIHAPREGSDGGRAGDRSGPCISIHAPRKGSDLVLSFSLMST